MLSIEYLINLKDLDYYRQIAEHFEVLEKEGEIVEYMTIVERVYEARGLEKGREAGKLEVARKLLKKGFSVDEVAEVTDLPRSEIQSNR